MEFLTTSAPPPEPPALDLKEPRDAFAFQDLNINPQGPEAVVVNPFLLRNQVRSPAPAPTRCEYIPGRRNSRSVTPRSLQARLAGEPRSAKGPAAVHTVRWARSRVRTAAGIPRAATAERVPALRGLRP